MRHGKKFNHLGRKTAHRKAMLSNMASSLIEHKNITTTLAKAKELRKFVEPLVTKGRQDNMHARRLVFSYLQNKEAVKELFATVIPKIGDRPGGYTRILKIGNRPGDNAEMAFIEFVDFNELAPGKLGSASGKKRRRRKASSGKKAASDVVEDAVVISTDPEITDAAVEVESVSTETVEEVETTPTEESAEGEKNKGE